MNMYNQLNYMVAASCRHHHSLHQRSGSEDTKQSINTGNQAHNRALKLILLVLFDQRTRPHTTALTAQLTMKRCEA